MKLDLGCCEGAVFDLDNTLTFDTDDLTRRANRVVLAQTDLPARFMQASGKHSLEELPRHAGADILTKFRLWTGEFVVDKNQQRELLEALETFAAYWRKKVVEVFAETAPQVIELCPGARETLDFYNREGRDFEIVTNNQRGIALVTLERSGLMEYSRALISANDVPKKPEPEGHLLAAHYLNTAPGEMISFGDTLGDMKAAMAARFAHGVLINPDTKILRGTELENDPRITQVESLVNLI